LYQSPQQQQSYVHVQENLIERIKGLDKQVHLVNLNLSKNCIPRIENLSHMHELSTLILSYNRLCTTDDLRHVLDIPSLQTLDLQSNRLEEDSLLAVLAAMPDLRVLYLQGNPVIKQIAHYRKTVVFACQQLRYLDDRPVFVEERRRVNAWGTALPRGIEAANEAERAEINDIRREKRERDERNFIAFEKMMQQACIRPLLRAS
jgi:dynein assembly factor 1